MSDIHVKNGWYSYKMGDIKNLRGIQQMGDIHLMGDIHQMDDIHQMGDIHKMGDMGVMQLWNYPPFYQQTTNITQNFPLIGLCWGNYCMI